MWNYQAAIAHAQPAKSMQYQLHRYIDVKTAIGKYRQHGYILTSIQISILSRKTNKKCDGRYQKDIYGLKHNNEKNGIKVLYIHLKSCAKISRSQKDI